MRSIQVKVSLIGFLAALMTALLTGVSIYGQYRLSNAQDQLLVLTQASQANEKARLFADVLRTDLLYALTAPHDEGAELRAASLRHVAGLREGWKTCVELDLPAELHPIATRGKEVSDRYLELVNALLEQSLKEPAAVRARLADVDRLCQEMEGVSKQLADLLVTRTRGLETLGHQVASFFFYYSILGFTGLVGTLGIAHLFLLRFLRNLAALRGVFEQIAQGDLTARIQVGSDDEIGQMGRVLNSALETMWKTVTAVQKLGIEVAGVSTEFAATAREQEASSAEQAASAIHVVSAARQIAGTSQELVQAMGEVARIAEQTAQVAGGGRTEVDAMHATMRQILQAVEELVAKLSALREKTGNISTVITTISRVSEQTNLLSLNAAIEAEKAGEFGRGFGVVAREIRRLSDQTAAASLDIEHMIREMQASVSAGVMSMDKFNEDIRRGVHEVNHFGEQLAQVIEQVEALSPRFDTVLAGMQTQSLGADQIREAMGQLGENAQNSLQSVRQSTAAVTRLKDTALALRESVSTFRV